jgi:hypothetical protein
MDRHSTLFNVLKILPTDYEAYGGQIRRWEDSEKDYPDCSGGCKHFVPLDGDLKFDWGVCANKKSPRAGLLTWEHQAGVDCFEKEEENEENYN